MPSSPYDEIVLNIVRAGYEFLWGLVTIVDAGGKCILVGLHN